MEPFIYLKLKEAVRDSIESHDMNIMADRISIWFAILCTRTMYTNSS